MNTATANDTSTTLAPGDKVVVTRYYGREIDTPDICTVVSGTPDSEGDLYVTDPTGVSRYAYRHCYTRIPKPGERVIAVEVPGVETHNGRQAVVADLGEGSAWRALALQYGNMRDGKPRLYVRFDDDRLYYCSKWSPVEEGAVETVEETPLVERTLADRIGSIVTLTPEVAAMVNRMGTVEDAAVEYVRLRAAHDALSETVERLRREVAGLRGDLTLGANTVRDQAVERDWCAEFETVNERLVAQMSSYGASIWEVESSRSREFEVEVQVPVSGTARRTFTVTAPDEDAARDTAMEMAQEDMDLDDVDSYDVNWDWYSAESEVQ
jgi:hypothetical protein